MAFWGVEVRPGNRYMHHRNDSHGRLRICQATLGMGSAVTKSGLQCIVGNRSPILLCSLIPNVVETCHLELEFEEDGEVIFSVLGRRSVHLSGYFLRPKLLMGGDESDSYGEDIGEEDSSSYDKYDSDKDKYESDFIDDRDLETVPPSPKYKSSVVIKEIADKDKPANGNANWRCLKRRHVVSDTDSDDDFQCQPVVNVKSDTDEEEEDVFPISFFPKKKKKVKDIRPLRMISNGERVSGDPEQDMDDTEVGMANIETKIKKDLLAGAHVNVVEKDEKLKKKKKDAAKKGKACQTYTDFSTERIEKGAERDPNELINSEVMDEVLPVGLDELPNNKDENSKKNTKKSKKKRVNDISQGKEGGMQLEKGRKTIEGKSCKDAGNVDDDRTVLDKGDDDNAAAAANISQQEVKQKKKKSMNQELSNLVPSHKKEESIKTGKMATILTVEEASKGRR